MIILCWTVICGIAMFRTDPMEGAFMWIVGLIVGGMMGAFTDD